MSHYSDKIKAREILEKVSRPIGMEKYPMSQIDIVDPCDLVSPKDGEVECEGWGEE